MKVRWLLSRFDTFVSNASIREINADKSFDTTLRGLRVKRFTTRLYEVVNAFLTLGMLVDTMCVNTAVMMIKAK